MGFLKPHIVTVFCLAASTFSICYDFVVMHDRRELVLRLVQGLGLALIALALAFYVFPQLIWARHLGDWPPAGSRAHGRGRVSIHCCWAIPDSAKRF